MNDSKLRSKLMAVARAHKPGGHVPYAFEKRILARIKALPSPLNPWAFWERGLMRAAMLSVAATLIVSAGLRFLPASNEPENLALDMQTTLFAAVDNTAADYGSDSR